VFLIDAKRKQLWSVASDSGREFRIPIDAGIAGAVATTGETINIADCYADDRFNQENDKKTGFRTNNMLAMPLKAGDVNALPPFSPDSPPGYILRVYLNSMTCVATATISSSIVTSITTD